MDREQRESKHWYDKLFTFNLTNFPPTLCLKTHCSEVSVFSICKFLQSLYKPVRCEYITQLIDYRLLKRLYAPYRIFLWSCCCWCGILLIFLRFIQIVQMSTLCHLHEKLKPQAHCIHLIISSRSDAEFLSLSAVMPSSILLFWKALALLTILSRISCYSLKGLEDYCPDICKYQWNFISADHGF